MVIMKMKRLLTMTLLACVIMTGCGNSNRNETDTK